MDFILSLAVRRTYADGELVHERGDDRPGMVIVVRGRLKLVTPRSNGRETFVSYVSPGQHYGDDGLQQRTRRDHRAIAVGITEVDHVSQEDFPRLLERPAIVRALYEVASYRLALLTQVIDDMRTLPLETRLAKLLLVMHQTMGEPTHITMVQEDFANLLGVSTVSLSKALRQLRQQGIADTGYRQIIISDPARLQEWLVLHDPD